MEKWYVVQSKPRNEELLWRQLSLRNVESYYPCIHVKTVNPRAKKVRPFFPGYLFCHIDLELVSKSSIEWIPGGYGLVSFGNEPASISGDLVLAIKQKLENLKELSGENTNSLRKGNKVVVNNGVLKGYEGIFDSHLSGTDRVRVLMSIMEKRKIFIEMPSSCVKSFP